MVEPSSPVASPVSPANSTSSSSSQQSSRSQSSNASSSSSASGSASPTPLSPIRVTVASPKVEEVDVDNDIIELSSDSEAEQVSLSPVSSSSSEPPEDDLEIIDELKQMHKQFQLKLDKLEKRVKKRRKLQQERTASVIVANGPVPPPELDQEPLPSTSRQESKKGLKRKLEIVTEELSRSRMEHAKKLRKNAPKEQMVIEIPDFPMEYYDISANYALYFSGTNDWCDHFNRNPEVVKFSSYYNWIIERTNNLLPEVLKIMQNTQKRNPSDQLKNADLLACRQVCKSWKQCLEKYLQEQVSFQGNLESRNSLSSVATKISSSRLEKFGELLTTVRTPLGNHRVRAHPFPSRHLRIEVHPIYRVESSNYFETGMKLLLDLLGDAVSYLSFISYQETSRFFEVTPATGINWFAVRNWLLKMPNLRGVNFQFSPTTVFKSEEILRNESLILASNSFPSLAKLEFIECRLVPSVLVQSMLSKNSHIQKLSNFQTYNEHVLPWSDYQLTVLSNLSYFSVNIYKISQAHTIKSVQWPLRNLFLSSMGPMAETWNLDKVFEILGNFKNTLKQLRFKLRVNIPDKDLKLPLPYLEKVDLCFQQNSADQISYDFILPLNSLQCLKVNFNWEKEATGTSNGNGMPYDNGTVDENEE